MSLNDPALESRFQRIQALGYDYAAEPKETITACNLCGNDQFIEITQQDRYGFPAVAAGCSRCGLVTLQPRMTREAYGRFYGYVYRPLVSAYHGRLINAETIQGEQRDYARAKARHLGTPRGRARFLDIGGSTGVVAAELAQALPLDVTVIDPAPDETVVAEKLGFETITGFFEEWDPKGRQFEFIGLFQTIDHLADIRSTLEQVRRVLAPGGVFLVDIVDVLAAMRRAWNVQTAIKIDHIFSLTEFSTEAFLRRAGLAWSKKVYEADHLHITYVCQAVDPEPDALPDPMTVKAFFEEVRKIQNTP